MNYDIDNLIFLSGIACGWIFQFMYYIVILAYDDLKKQRKKNGKK